MCGSLSFHCIRLVILIKHKAEQVLEHEAVEIVKTVIEEETHVSIPEVMAPEEVVET